MYSLPVVKHSKVSRGINSRDRLNVIIDTVHSFYRHARGNDMIHMGKKSKATILHFSPLSMNTQVINPQCACSVMVVILGLCVCLSVYTQATRRLRSDTNSISSACVQRI